MRRSLVPLSVLAFLLFARAAAPAAPEADTLLVLPFSNPSSNRQLDWIGDSISEILIENLAAEGVDVVAPELRDQTMDEMSLRRYAVLTRASAMEAAVQANASLVLYGMFEIRPAPGRTEPAGTVRISAHLLDARRLRRLGSFLVEKPLAELSAAQTSLAWQVLHALRPEFLVTEEEFSRNHPAVRLDALEHYARGLRAASLEQKHKLFATAARLAPDFSPALYQLGRLNLLAFRNYPSAASWFEKVSQTDIHYRESLFYLGYCRYRTGEFAAAAAAYRKLAAMAPLPEVLNNLGAVLLRLNDPEALGVLRSAAEANSADPDIAFNLGYALWRNGSFEEAADVLRRSLQSGDDATATLLLGRCLQRQGPRPGEIRLEGQERLKTDYNESAWRALRSLVGGP
ncbi:MAG: tetratricopeptide repeat protein [Bryobacteraceae bacterium]|nr:tetratricopeptide repeat protein [Bryobacteraceae bacterium]MCX7603016.1 tetratricopeptide repeat protein [Bryobacteraceae bacterium]